MLLRREVDSAVCANRVGSIPHHSHSQVFRVTAGVAAAIATPMEIQSFILLRINSQENADSNYSSISSNAFAAQISFHGDATRSPTFKLAAMGYSVDAVSTAIADYDAYDRQLKEASALVYANDSLAFQVQSCYYYSDYRCCYFHRVIKSESSASPRCSCPFLAFSMLLRRSKQVRQKTST